MIGFGDFIILCIRAVFLFFGGYMAMMVGCAMMIHPVASLLERVIGIGVMALGLYMLYRFARRAWYYLVRRPIGGADR